MPITGGWVIGITKLLQFFPVSGDDPALISFCFGYDDQDSTFKRAREQPYEAAEVALTRRSFENRRQLVDGEHRLFNAEAPLASTLFDVRGVVNS
jgi:hypothetical protein